MAVPSSSSARIVGCSYCVVGSVGGREGGIAVVSPRHGARRSPNGPLMLDLGCPFWMAKTLRYFHSGSGASRSVGFFCTVSNLRWNCGDTWPVKGLSTRATDLAWLGDVPHLRYTPNLERCLHFGALCPLCTALSRTYVGQPKA